MDKISFLKYWHSFDNLLKVVQHICKFVWAFFKFFLEISLAKLKDDEEGAMVPDDIMNFDDVLRIERFQTFIFSIL